MRRALLVPLSLAAACAPPPAGEGSGGEPGIRLLFPKPATVPAEDGSNAVSVDENGTNHMRLDPDGRLRFTAVVEFDNIEFVAPSGEPIAGEAHWHLFVDPTTPQFYVASRDLFAEVVTPPLTPDANGTVHTIRARLQQNDHSELPCVATGACSESSIQSSLEFQLDAPEGGFDTGDTDTDGS